MNKHVSAWLRNGKVRTFQSSHRPDFALDAQVYFLTGMDRGALIVELFTPLIIGVAGVLFLYAGFPAGGIGVGAATVIGGVRVFKYLTAARYGVLINAQIGDVALQMSRLKTVAWSYVRNTEHGDGPYPRAAVERELCHSMDVFDAALVASELEDFITTVHQSPGMGRALRAARV